MDDTSLDSGSDKNGYFPKVYGNLRSCPHCSAARPSLVQRYEQQDVQPSELFGKPIHWAIYECTTRSLPVALIYKKNSYGSRERTRHEYKVFPSRWKADEQIPRVPRNYLMQAEATLGSPDASVVMSASAIDAMLKVKGLVEGSLYKRIDKAVADGILTKDMSDWAHLVRLNSNNPRHADIEKPNMTGKEATLSLDFAKALAEIFFVLPSRMPKAEEER